MRSLDRKKAERPLLTLGILLAVRSGGFSTERLGLLVFPEFSKDLL
jgi:hypothetical protein